MLDVPHIGFILAAYCVTATVLTGTVAAVVLDGRALRRALARTEARGTLARDRAPRVASDFAEPAR